jgi:PAS domain S-box-containing protein
VAELRESGIGVGTCFDLLVEAVSDYVLYVLDPDGRVSEWNAGAERLLGYAAPDILGRHHKLFFTATEQAGGVPEAALRQAAQDGRAEAKGWRLRRDGSRFWATAQVSAIRRGGGELLGFAIIARDISTPARLEGRFREVVESAPAAMIMVNRDGLVEMVNTQTERLFGYSRLELVGQPVEKLVPERFRARHPGLRDDFFSVPAARPVGAGRDLYALRRDGSEVPVEIGLNPISTDEGSMVIAAIVDISDRKHKEESIRAALREKELLLQEIHHRVKNNLQIIHSLLDMQFSGVGEPAVAEMVREAQSRIQSMALIHQMLYQSGDFAEVDFRDFLQAFVPYLASAYGAEPSRVVVSVDACTVRLPINLAIPCGLAVNELISNALKHGFPAGRAGEVSVRLATSAEGELSLSVSDDGVGLPANFALARTATLGMQLLTLLAEQLGGELAVEPRQPTRFTLRFPLQR